MLHPFPRPRVFLGLTVLTFLVGCVGLPEIVSTNEPPPPRPPVPPRVQPDQQSTTELRIPGEPVAKANDIPVVPVPPIPLGQGSAPRLTVSPASPEIRQVSTQPPPLPQPALPSTEREPADLKQVIQQANDAYAKLDSYIARLTRREQINGKNKPEELMLFKFRKQPWSVYFKWLGTEGHDREVVYVRGQYEGKIHTLLAAGDVPLMPAGKRMSLAPDSVLVKSACRYPITEAGIGANIERITALFAALERGDKTRGTLTDLGVKTRDDYQDGALRLIEQRIPVNVEPEMPGGGKRLYGFDTRSHLPVLLICVDDKGKEVEYYRYDRVELTKLDNADFNPDKMGVFPPKMAQKP